MENAVNMKVIKFGDKLGSTKTSRQFNEETKLFKSGDVVVIDLLPEEKGIRISHKLSNSEKTLKNVPLNNKVDTKEEDALNNCDVEMLCSDSNKYVSSTNMDLVGETVNSIEQEPLSTSLLGEKQAITLISKKEKTGKIFENGKTNGNGVSNNTSGSIDSRSNPCGIPCEIQQQEASNPFTAIKQEVRFISFPVNKKYLDPETKCLDKKSVEIASSKIQYDCQKRRLSNGNIKIVANPSHIQQKTLSTSSNVTKQNTFAKKLFLKPIRKDKCISNEGIPKNNKFIYKGKVLRMKPIADSINDKISPTNNIDRLNCEKKTTGTQTDIYSQIQNNGNLYMLYKDGDSSFKFKTMEQTMMVDKGIQALDTLCIVHDSKPGIIAKSSTSKGSFIPKNVFDETLFTTLGILPVSYEPSHQVDPTPVMTSFQYPLCSTPLHSYMKDSSNIEPLPASIRKLLEKLSEDKKSCLIEDKKGNIPLHRSVIEGNSKHLRSQCIILKSINSHLNHLNYMGETALMLAVKMAKEIDMYIIVKTLLDENADQTIEDQDGMTPLHWAVYNNCPQLVQILLSAKDSHKVINKYSYDGYAPIHLAAMEGHESILELLASRGADIHLKDRKSGRTAYFHAVERQHIETALLLKKYKASVSVPNFAGQHPPSFASALLETGKTKGWSESEQELRHQESNNLHSLHILDGSEFLVSPKTKNNSDTSDNDTETLDKLPVKPQKQNKSLNTINNKFNSFDGKNTKSPSKESQNNNDNILHKSDSSVDSDPSCLTGNGRSLTPCPVFGNQTSMNNHSLGKKILLTPPKIIKTGSNKLIKILTKPNLADVSINKANPTSSALNNLARRTSKPRIISRGVKFNVNKLARQHSTSNVNNNAQIDKSMLGETNHSSLLKLKNTQNLNEDGSNRCQMLQISEESLEDHMSLTEQNSAKLGNNKILKNVEENSNKRSTSLKCTFYPSPVPDINVGGRLNTNNDELPKLTQSDDKIEGSLLNTLQSLDSEINSKKILINHVEKEHSTLCESQLESLKCGTEPVKNIIKTSETVTVAGQNQEAKVTIEDYIVDHSDSESFDNETDNSEDLVSTSMNMEDMKNVLGLTADSVIINTANELNDKEVTGFSDSCEEAKTDGLLSEKYKGNTLNDLRSSDLRENQALNGIAQSNKKLMLSICKINVGNKYCLENKSVEGIGKQRPDMLCTRQTNTSEQFCVQKQALKDISILKTMVKRKSSNNIEEVPNKKMALQSKTTMLPAEEDSEKLDSVKRSERSRKPRAILDL